MGPTLDLAGTVVEIAPDGHSRKTLDRAKLVIRDVLGVALYGSRHPVGEHIGAFVDATPSGTAATLVGGGTAARPRPLGRRSGDRDARRGGLGDAHPPTRPTNRRRSSTSAPHRSSTARLPNVWHR